MSGVLSDKDLARLQTHFCLPLIAGEAMEAQRLLTADEEYAFHEVLSDMQPDAALICMALCCEQMSLNHAADIPAAAALMMEADRILSAYGLLWLAHADQDEDLHEALVMDILKNIPEDMECLEELVAGLELELPANAYTAAQILNIVSIQIDAQTMVAECHLEAAGLCRAEQQEAAPIMLSSVANDNGARIRA